MTGCVSCDNVRFIMDNFNRLVGSDVNFDCELSKFWKNLHKNVCLSIKKKLYSTLAHSDKIQSSHTAIDSSLQVVFRYLVEQN